MVAYLEMNRFTWKCGEVEETAMVLRAAAKEMKEDARSVGGEEGREELKFVFTAEATGGTEKNRDRDTELFTELSVRVCVHRLRGIIACRRLRWETEM
jgi:hypothetical protein